MRIRAPLFIRFLGNYVTRMIRVLFLIVMVTAVHSTGQCLIKDQPFKDDVAFARCLGRWYAVERLTGVPGVWHGTIYDMYDDNGMLFLNVTDLEFNGKCEETRTRRISLNPDDPREASLYGDSALVSTMYTPGGSFSTFWVAYFCPSEHMKDGACSRPQVDIMSRTMIMADEERATATSLRDTLCMPSVNYVYQSASYDSCMEDKVPHADACNDKFIPYLNTYDIMKVMGRWYLRVLYLPDDSSPDSDLLGMTADIERADDTVHISYYVARGQECHKLGPATLEMPEVKGKLIRDRYNDNVTHANIFDTDFTNYLIVWYCNGPPDSACENPQVRLWSRGPVVSTSTKTWTKTALKFLCNLSNEFQFPNAEIVNCPRSQAEGSGSPSGISTFVTTHVITAVAFVLSWTF